MWGYPHIPARTKVSVLPWLALAALVAVLLDGWGWVDLGLEPAGQHRTHRGRRPAASSPPSRAARANIPPGYLRLYRQTGRGEVWRSADGRRYAAWAVLAGVGAVESGHGQSRLPGVRSGVNSFGCCAGPMQFNLRNGPPSTWDAYGRGSPYDPADAIPAARRLLVADGARRNVDRALYSYNHSWAYVAQVKALARSYARR